MLLASLLLLGCAPVPAQHDCDLAGPHVVVGTSDFASGALAAVTLDGDEVCVADRLVSTGPDAVVRVTDHHTWVVNRTGSDTLLAYEHGDYATPALEVVVAPGGNAHDLVAHEGQLFVALYDEPRVLVLDLDGVPVGEVDLSPHADADGLPEVDALVVTDAGLFASLQRLDRDDGWRGTTGEVVQIDVDTLQVIGSWATGPNPRLARHPDGRRLVALTGHYFEADGALEIIDPSEPSVSEEVLHEQGVRVDLGVLADDVVLATAFEVGGDSLIARWQADELVPLRTSPAWFADALAVSEGVVVASRQGFGGVGDGELLWVDDDGVQSFATGFALDPFSLAWVP